MITIYKYQLTIVEEQEVKLPISHIIRSIQFQGNQGLQMWVEVDTESPEEEVTILIYGTGHPIIKTPTYITTVQDGNGALVWHIYKKLR